MEYWTVDLMERSLAALSADVMDAMKACKKAVHLVVSMAAHWVHPMVSTKVA